MLLPGPQQLQTLCGGAAASAGNTQLSRRRERRRAAGKASGRAGKPKPESPAASAGGQCAAGAAPVAGQYRVQRLRTAQWSDAALYPAPRGAVFQLSGRVRFRPEKYRHPDSSGDTDAADKASSGSGTVLPRTATNPRIQDRHPAKQGLAGKCRRTVRNGQRQRLADLYPQ
ncbi:hypothetical protein D3C84_836220 [compost metagenome]